MTDYVIEKLTRYYTSVIRRNKGKIVANMKKETFLPPIYTVPAVMRNVPIATAPQKKIHGVSTIKPQPKVKHPSPTKK